MFYNRILRIWVVDTIDYFLISLIVGRLIGLYLKNYLSEKESLKRLKLSIINKSDINKSKLLIRNKKILNPKDLKLKKIYRMVFETYGGDFQEHLKYNGDIFNFAQEIKENLERLASFLKERELQGFAKIFFKNGRLFLELILYTCKKVLS